MRGIFTDSDLARLFESRRDDQLDEPIRHGNDQSGRRTVPLGSMLADAVEIMAERKISELPVVDADGQPHGMLDITDIVGLFPQSEIAAKSAQPATLPIPRPKSRGFFQPSRTTSDERA